MMGPKYEIRFYVNKDKEQVAIIATDSWWKLMKLRLTKNVIMYTVRFK